MSARLATLLTALVVVTSACSGSDADTAGPLRVLTHDSFAISDGVMEAFTEETGIEVEILRGGDAGTVVSGALLVAGNPTADVLFGIDNILLGRAIDRGLFEPYVAAGLDDVHDFLRTDNQVTPIDFGDVCLNYDKARLEELSLDVPTALEDLTDERYRGTLVVENPASSSPGLAFLLATIATFPEDSEYTWKDFWADLRTNDVEVVAGWEEAYFDAFAGGGGAGDLPLVVSYASSPAAGVYFADPAPTVSPTGNIDAGCFRQVEYAGILAGSPRREAAGRFIDFMLSETFQSDIPLNMFVYPARASVALPDVFVTHADVPRNTVGIELSAIAANRERWIEEWTDIFR